MRICREDLNEVIATFVQDKTTIERGLFDAELIPEELTQVRMGKIIKDKFPELDTEDQESFTYEWHFNDPHFSQSTLVVTYDEGEGFIGSISDAWLN